jgi:hypothetical protein
MTEETPFTPQEIDEQIDHFSQALPPPAAALPEQQLADDLRALYAAERNELFQAVARGRERLAQQNAMPLPRAQIHQTSDQHRFLYERQQTMQALKTRFTGEQKQLYRIGSLVAAVLLVVLIGGLVTGLVLVRQHQHTQTIQGTSSFQGGLEITFQATCAMNGNHCTQQQLALLPDIIPILKGRIKDGLGISQPVVRQQMSDQQINDQIVVDLPSQVLTRDALALLTPVGKLEFIDTGPSQLIPGTEVTSGQYPVRFTGTQLDPNSIQATIDQQRGHPFLVFQFKDQYRAAFADYTQQNIGNYLTLTLDGKVIVSAVIQSQITDQGQITIGYTLADVQETATLIRYGSVPVPLTVVNEETITT